eukprot:1138975-Pyramimonas_sp.AAC.1
MNPATDILYRLVNEKSQVIHHNKMVAVGSVLDEVRVSNPAKAIVAYHDMVEKAVEGTLGCFDLELRCGVAYSMPKELMIGSAKPEQTENGKTPQTKFGALLPASSWATSESEVAWGVKWSRKGLMPVAPRVVLVRSVTLPPASALVFSSSSSSAGA